ncbi:type III-B CRISPR module-associated protein Cmr5 [Pelagibius sp. CAU 1746]|uniref:type III-B CRISPR module-associated protein Cmr5 n=1 Tax=Pelagibius sp. CAU 1746 TaxID=3140370 RepID=UPI00325BF24B
MSQSLAQKRAGHALDQIQKMHRKDEYGNYVAYVKALPAAIIMSGLGQALAMEKARGPETKTDKVSRGHANLYYHLNTWLCKDWQDSPYSRGSDVLEEITRKSEADYIRAQAEALAYLEWLKKFAVATLRDPGNVDGG